jgi:hypothetical protein
MGAGLIPTLVFTLIIAEILRDRFGVPSWLFGGLVIYALGNTMIPGFILRVPSAELDDPDMPDVVVPEESTPQVADHPGLRW